VTMTRTYGWQRFYEAAILETNRSSLPRLIQTAQAAIDARIQQLQLDHHGSAEERQAIADALVGLGVLRKEIN
jgi:oligoribonuclease NrnB/cAMP/cGMP phosphodiesterase (DHH superfamily)